MTHYGIAKTMLAIVFLLACLEEAQGADYQALRKVVVSLQSPSEVLGELAISARRTQVNESYTSAYARFQDGAAGPTEVAGATIHALITGDASLYAQLALIGGEEGRSLEDVAEEFASMHSGVFQYSTVQSATIHGNYELGAIQYVDVTMTRPGESFRDFVLLFPTPEGYRHSRTRLFDPLVQTFLASLAYEGEHPGSVAMEDANAFEHHVAIDEIFGIPCGDSPVRVHFNGGRPSWGATVFGGPSGLDYVPATPSVGDPNSSAIEFFREVHRLLSEISPTSLAPSDPKVAEFLSRLTPADATAVRRRFTDSSGFTFYRDRRLEFMRIAFIMPCGPIVRVYWTDGESKSENGLFVEGGAFKFSGITSGGLSGSLFAYPELSDYLFAE